MWHFFSECKPSLSHLIFIIFHQNLPRILSEFHLRIIFDVSNCQNIHSQNQNCRFKKFRQKICATKCSDLRNRRGQIAIWAMPKYTHCSHAGPHLGTWVAMGTSFRFWVPIGSPFFFKVPIFSILGLRNGPDFDEKSGILP